MTDATALTTMGVDELELLERVLMVGDLAQLSPQDRLDYYAAVCRSLGLNPMTRPFEYVKFDGRLQLYARKDCAEQLRRIHNISIIGLSAEQRADLYVVTATASTPEGRTDVDQGVVDTANLRGQMLANAWMKAATKAKRRVTLSLCGLGIVDETELETIPGARSVRVDEATGEILDTPALPPVNGVPARPADPAVIPQQIAPGASAARTAALREWQRLWQLAGPLGLQEGRDALAADAPLDEINRRIRELAPLVADAREGAAASAPPSPAVSDAEVMVCNDAECGKTLTKGQYEVSLRAYGRALCPAHQKQAAKQAA